MLRFRLVAEAVASRLTASDGVAQPLQEKLFIREEKGRKVDHWAVSMQLISELYVSHVILT